MKHRSVLLAGLVLVAVPAFAQHAEFNYEDQVEGWGESCGPAAAGQQSPIRIGVRDGGRAFAEPPGPASAPSLDTSGAESEPPGPVTELLVAPRDFTLGPVPLIVENKGHTVGVYSPGPYTLRLGRPSGVSYASDPGGQALPFRQVHFHKPTEHEIRGAGGAGELEAHL